MKILHICNDYCGSKVHVNLIKELDATGVRQTVFTYFRNKRLIGENEFNAKGTEFIYSPILKKYHRYLYPLKRLHVYKRMKAVMDISRFDCIHATTLFSDGAIAYQAFKEYGIPYIVAVRNTDVDYFLRLAPHTWGYGRKILLNASKIIFISKALQCNFCKHPAIKTFLKKISQKFVCQPNGIDSFWIENMTRKPSVAKREEILYVGVFEHYKNVLRLIKAINELSAIYPDIRLNIVGGGGSDEKKVLKMIEQNPFRLVYYGAVYDKERLKDIYASCSIFAMPSIYETFGLVYVEALSQNLAVLYSKNQGIDGIFDSSIGESVCPKSVESIKDGLCRIIENRRIYNNERVDFSALQWKSIAEQYKKLYTSAINRDV